MVEFSAWTLPAASLLVVGVSSLYLLVGRRFALRYRAQREHAIGLFSLFWIGTGTYGLADGAWAFAVWAVDPPLAVGIMVLHVKVLAAVAGFFGLVYYLLYIYTGDRRLLVPLAVTYALIYAVLAAYYVWLTPTGHTAHTWAVGIDYARGRGLEWDLLVALLFMPPLVASGAYALLLRRVRHPLQRRRVMVVSASFATFFGGLFLGWLSGTWVWWPLAEKALALLAVAGVLLVTRTEVPRRIGSEGHIAVE